MHDKVQAFFLTIFYILKYGPERALGKAIAERVYLVKKIEEKRRER